MTLDEIRELNAFQLAADDLAGCGTPDSSESAGATLLFDVRNGFVDYVTAHPGVTADNARDAVFYIVDGAVSIYTHTKWQQFIDLQAYQEEPESGEDWPADLDKASDYALAQIADRLAYALIGAWEESQDEADEDES